MQSVNVVLDPPIGLRKAPNIARNTMTMRHPITLSLCLLMASSLNAQVPKPATTHGPLITFEKTEHDYGTIEQGADGACEFPFTNTGDEPLIISQFRTSCGCLVPSWDRDPVLPGKKGSVRLRYDTNRVGPINKSATVTSNSVDQPVLVLRIKGLVRPRPEEVASPAPTPSH